MAFLCLGVSSVSAGNQDQNAVHQNETGISPINISEMTPESNGPDYLVESIDLPVSEGITSPGAEIHPVIRVKNTGNREPETGQIPVSGYLNDTPLIPVSSLIPSNWEGKAREYTLSYKLPDSLNYGAYHLYLVIDPEGNTRDTNTSNNTGKAGGMLSVASPDTDEFFGCEACWKGYR
ncbi:MAG: hypothetical protein LUQ07_07805 [Methanospirillum sp.]|nr:hypothetical protein [Methanospirillum sp.]